MTTERVSIARRFNGPPSSGQGGYSCGLLGERFEGGNAAVSLRVPPPLERELERRREGERLALIDGRPSSPRASPRGSSSMVPEPVTLDRRPRGVRRLPVDRPPPLPDLLRLRPRALAGRGDRDPDGIAGGATGQFAATWTPLDDFATAAK